jgi:type VI secretion system protein ImpE
MTQKGTDLFRAGDLSGAISALTDAVKSKPTDEAARTLLAEMLFFAGAFDRADVQLNAISNMHPDKAVSIALWRQLVRGAAAREQLLTDGRMPEFLDPPGAHIQLMMRALIELRAGAPEAAAELMQQAEELRPPVAGHVDGRAFTDMRDLDDLFGPVMEVFTSTGKYFWVPLEQIETITFQPPARPSDLLWRQASMAVRGGTDGVVFIPAIYPTMPGDPEREDGLLLGRATDWHELPGGMFRGRGQRSFLIGEENVPIMTISDLTFTPAH